MDVCSFGTFVQCAALFKTFVIHCCMKSIVFYVTVGSLLLFVVVRTVIVCSHFRSTY